MYHGSVNRRYLEAISEALADGQLIVTPDNGRMLVACDCTSAKAVERMASLCGIDLRRDDLTLYCADISQASAHVRVDNELFAQLKAGTPGDERFEAQIYGQMARPLKARRTIGIAIPDDDITRAVAGELGRPLMGVVADWDDDDLDPTNAEAVAEYFGDSNFRYVIVS